jgi:hypothetical protein
MAKRTARRAPSRALARVSYAKPIVIKQTKLVKPKKHHGGRRGGGLVSGFLSTDKTEMMLAGAALGFIDKSSFAANLPKLPWLGEHGTIAVAAYMLSGGGKNKLASNVCKLALGLAAYELAKTGAITGDEDGAFGV